MVQNFADLLREAGLEESEIDPIMVEYDAIMDDAFKSGVDRGYQEGFDAGIEAAEGANYQEGFDDGYELGLREEELNVSD